MPTDAIAQIDRVEKYLAGPEGKEAYRRLVYFADRHVRGATGSIRNGGALLPNSGNGEDVVHEVLLSVTVPDAEGKPRRTIPPEHEIGLVLRTIIRSFISHSFSKKTLWVRNTGSPETDNQSKSTERDLENTAQSYWEPIGSYLTAEEHQASTNECRKFIEFARPDSLVHSMLTVMFEEEINKPSDLATRMGVPVQEIYVAKKRLATLTGKFRREKPIRQ